MIIKLIKICPCWVAGAGGGSGSSLLQDLCFDIRLVPSALCMPRAFHLPCISFSPHLAFEPFLLLQSQVPFQRFLQSLLRWRVDFFSVLVTKLSS